MPLHSIGLKREIWVLNNFFHLRNIGFTIFLLTFPIALLEYKLQFDRRNSLLFDIDKYGLG